MTREQFLSQYTGEWSPYDHWFGFWLATAGISRCTTPREARFGVYQKEHTAYALIGEYATPQEALAQCRIQGMPLGEILEDESTELLGQD